VDLEHLLYLGKDLDLTREYIRQTKKLTDKPFAVNLVLDFEQEDRIQICIEEKVPIVSFFWGDSSQFIAQLKKNNIIVCQTVGNSSEAIDYEKKGVDFLLAQGWETGGHVWGTVATSVLIPSIVDKVKIPVVATGGIADGRGILAAISLGADGVCMGTRFLMSNEANVNPIYQELINNASENDTIHVQRLFNIGWDNAPHRIIKNSTTEIWEKVGKPNVGNRPNENEIIAHKQNGQPILRYSDDGPIAGTTGNVEALALYAGQTVGLISSVKTASQIMADLVSELLTEFNKVKNILTEE
jgi:NAD(P)H-dependent flavin oxidoreductase YrpB (nitropropane dioxygenase family)